MFTKLSEQHLAFYTYSVGKINNVSRIKMWPQQMGFGRFPACVLFFNPSFSYFKSARVCGRST